ncbi:MAG TPA: VOC family protein [Pirellulales bacterium]
MILSLDHIQLAIPAGGEAKARDFYGSVLQLTELQKPEPLRRRGGVWYLLDDERQLHLGVEGDFRPAKKAHPCFVVEGYDELIERLCEAGFEVVSDDVNPPMRRFYTHDSFGNRLEFADRPSEAA